MEKREVEQNLLKSENRWLFAIEGINDGIWDWNVLTGDVFLSNRWKEMIGYIPDEIEGKLSEWKTRVHPEDLEEVMLKLQRHLTLETPDYSSEHRLLCKDGSWKWILSRGKVVERTVEGEPLRMLGTHTDISERKKAESLLLEDQKTFRVLNELMSDYIFKLSIQADGSFNMSVIAGNYERATGHSAEDSVDPDNWHKIIHPDDYSDLKANFRQIIEHKKAVSLTCRSYSADGALRWIEVLASPDIDNRTREVKAIYGSVRNITERMALEAMMKESEMKYRSLANSGIALIWTSGTDKLCNYFNETWLGFTGRTLEQEMGNGWLEGVHPEDLNRCLETYVSAFDKQEPFEMEYRLRHSNGEYRWILDLGTPNFNNSGEFIGYIGHCFDISERKKAEEQLKQSEAALNYSQEIAKMGSWEFNYITRKVYWSKSYYILLGLTPDEKEVPSDAFDKMVHPDDKHLVDEILTEIYQNRKPASVDLRVILPDGQIKWVQNNIVPVFEGEMLIALKGVNIDITKQKLAEQEIRQLNENLEARIIDRTTQLENVNEHLKNEIANRLLIEAELELEKKRLADIIKGTNVGTWEWNIQTGETIINERWADIIGYTLDEISPVSIETWTKFAHPDDFKQSGELLEKHFTGQSDYYAFESRIKHKNGEWIWVLDRGKVHTWDEAGNPLKMSGTHQDITQQKMTEIALRESREHLDLVIKGSNDAPWDWNLVTDHIVYSTKWWQQLGYTSDKIPSDSNLWRNLTHPDDIERINLIFNNALKGGNDSYEAEFRLLHKEGHYVPVLSRGYISRDNSGKPVRVTGTNMDLTERNKAAEVLKWNRTLLELMSNSSPLGFLVVDNRTDAILYFNQRFCQIWEIQHIEDQMRRNELKNNDIIPYCLPVLADIPAFAESCKPLQDEANRIVVEDEIAFTDNRTIRRFTTQIRGEHDEYFGRFYIFEDITQRKRVELEIRKARNEAEKANLAKSEFLSRMSHELRTPMNSILGFAQLMNMGDLNPKLKKAVSHILSSGNHLLNLIDEVLDISRIEAGRMVLFNEPVLLKGVIEEMMDIFQPLAHDRQLKLLCDFSTETRLLVISDRKRLKQVLINLLSNAVKYNTLGGTILLTTELLPQNETDITAVRIAVTDTGLGIAPEDIPKLFVPFERIGADKTQMEGTGLGLAIVKKIMEAMNGTVGVESVVGKGSTFWIDLPVAEEQNNRLEKKGKDRNLAGQTVDTFKVDTTVMVKTRTILYIEDNIANAQLVEEIIENHRPEIQLITSIFGKHAVQLAVDHAPDLILLDLDLPDIKGSEVLANIYADEKTNLIPVVILTADATQYQIEKLMAAGAREYLTKPLDIIRFLQVVDELI